jgi:hypothetical protein
MSSEDDELRDGLSRWRVETDPEGAFDRVASRRARRRTLRRVQVAALALTVVAGTVGGSYALSRLFRGSNPKPSAPIGRPAAAGERIAFVSDRDGNDEIYTMKPDGSDVRRLTTDRAEDLQPAWSPDGSRIAFISNRGGSYQIWVMGADGQNARVLTHVPYVEWGSQISWAPAATIAFAGISPTPYATECPPPGCTPTDFGVDILTVDPVDGAVTDLIPYPLDQIQPAWGPTGATIQFVGVSSVAACVLSVAVSRGQIVPHGGAPNAGRCLRLNSYAPSTSPVDGRIAFQSADHIYVWSIGPAQTLAVGTDPSWSPNASRITFVSEADGKGELFVMNSDGSGARQLTPPHFGSNRQPAWSPPSTSIPTPIPSQTESPEASPSPSPTPSPSVSDACSTDETTVSGDLDGNGLQDLAVVGPTECLVHDRQPNDQFDTPFVIHVQWDGGPTEGTWPLPECDRACAGVAAADLDGNGTDEFLLDVDEGASTVFIQAYELPPSERGPVALLVAPPGNGEYPPDLPIRLTIEGSVRYQYFVTCQGPDEVIATSDSLSDDSSTWAVTETHFTFDGSAFTITSVKDSQAPTDPNAPKPPPRIGQPCWINANPV